MKREITDSRSNHNFANDSAESSSVVRVTPERPKALRVEPEGIPTELKNIPRWVNWKFQPKDGKWTKVPLHPQRNHAANCSDSKNWRTYETALDRSGGYDTERNMELGVCEETAGDGIGFVLIEDDDLIGLDCDNCVESNPNEELKLNSSGQKFFDFWNSQGACLELSPSGKGLRGFIRGQLPDGIKLKNNVEGCTWEIYETVRYMTITGHKVSEAKEIPQVSTEVMERYRDQFMQTSSGSRSTGSSQTLKGLSRVKLKALEDKRKERRFGRLFNGEWESIVDENGLQNYPSHSEADLAFCGMLAKAGFQFEEIVAAWKLSKLWRPEKCEDRSDYVERTIHAVLPAPFLVLTKKTGDLLKIDQPLAAKEFSKLSQGKLLCVNSTFYRYEEKLGIWKLLDDSKIRSEVQQLLESSTGKFGPKGVINPGTVKGIAEILGQRTEILRSKETHRWNVKPDQLVLANGVLDLKTRKLGVFSKELLATVRSPVRYYENASCPKWETFLEQVVPNPEDRLRLQEWVGYLLWYESKLEKLLLLYGSGRNGKSTFIEIISDLFAPEEVSAIDPSLFSEDKYLARLEHMRINVVTDIRTDKTTSERLKQIVSGEKIEARRLHQNPFSFVPRVKLLLSANALPQTHDRSDGYYRRYDVLKFEVQIPEDQVDRNLKQKLRAELPGILNWAVNGLARLQDNNWKMTEAPGFEAGMASLRDYTDVVKEFLEEFFEVIGVQFDSSGKIAQGNTDYVLWLDLMKLYKAYCSKSNHRPMNGKRLEQELARFDCYKGQKRIGKEHTGGGRKRESVVHGLRAFEDLDSMLVTFSI